MNLQIIQKYNINKYIIEQSLYDTQFLKSIFNICLQRPVRYTIQQQKSGKYYSQLFFNELDTNNADNNNIIQFYDKIIEYLVNPENKHNNVYIVNEDEYNINQPVFYLQNIDQGHLIVNRHLDVKLNTQQLITKKTTSSSKTINNKSQLPYIYDQATIFGSRSINVVGFVLDQFVANIFDNKQQNQSNIIAWIFNQISHFQSPFLFNIDDQTIVPQYTQLTLIQTDKFINDFLQNYGYFMTNIPQQQYCLQFINIRHLQQYFFIYLQQQDLLSTFIQLRKPNRYIQVDSVNSDEMYLTRIVKSLYVKLYGHNPIINTIRNRQELYVTMPVEQVNVLQKQLNLFVQQLHGNKCEHLILTNLINTHKNQDNVIQLIEQFYDYNIIKKDPFYQFIDIAIKDVIVHIPIEFIRCKLCSADAICAHKLVQIILQHDYPNMVKILDKFRIIDPDQNQFNYFCKYCGEILNNIDFEEEIEQVRDQHKKYKLFWISFINRYKFVLSSFIVDTYKIFNDFIIGQYNHIKELCIPIKNDSDYVTKKVDIINLFLFAYFMSFQGNNIIFDYKAAFKQLSINQTLDSYIITVKSITSQYKVKSLLSSQQQSQLDTINQILQQNPIFNELIGNRTLKDLYTKQQQQDNVIIIDIIALYKFTPEQLTIYNQKCDQLTLSDIMKKPALLQQIITISALQIQQNKLNFNIVDSFQLKRDSINFNRRTGIKDDKRFKIMSDKYYFISNDFFQIILETVNHQYINNFYQIYCYKQLSTNQKKYKHYFDPNNRKCQFCLLIQNKQNYIDFQPEYIKLLTKSYIQHFNVVFTVNHKNTTKYKESQTISISYQESFIANFAKKINVQPIQLINLGGFDYIQYDTQITHIYDHQQFQSLIKQQINKYKTTITFDHSKTYQPSQPYPSDLSFVNQIPVTKDLYWNRLNKIYYLFIELINSLAKTQETREILHLFIKFYQHIKNVPNNNSLIICQCFIMQILSFFIPELIKHNSQDLIELNIKKMIEQDKKHSITQVFVGFIAQKMNKLNVDHQDDQEQQEYDYEDNKLKFKKQKNIDPDNDESVDLRPDGEEDIPEEE